MSEDPTEFREDIDEREVYNNYQKPLNELSNRELIDHSYFLSLMSKEQQRDLSHSGDDFIVRFNKIIDEIFERNEEVPYIRMVGYVDVYPETRVLHVNQGNVIVQDPEPSQ